MAQHVVNYDGSSGPRSLPLATAAASMSQQTTDSLAV
jgi:hypothetical protein